MRRALDRVEDTADPYMRVRLYWSMARLAHAEGRESVALDERSQGDRAPAGDRRHVPSRPRTHPRGVHHARARRPRRRRPAPRPGRAVPRHVADAAGPVRDHDAARPSRARSAARPTCAIALATRAVELSGDDAPVDRGVALAALGEALSLTADATGAGDAYAEAVELLEGQGRWRHGGDDRSRLGPHAASGRPRGRGARRARSRRCPRHARDARRRARRALTLELAVRPRGPYSLAPLRAPRKRRDAHVPRRALHGPARRRRTAGARAGLAVARRHRDDPGGVAAGSRAAAVDPRARRRPLRLSARGTRRSDARPCRSHAPRAPPAARRDRGAGAAARVLRPADRGEARPADGADDHPHDLPGRPRAAAPRADDAELAALAPSKLRALGLHTRRGASLVRLCRTIELERLHDVETAGRRGAARARTRPRPVVGRRRLPRKGSAGTTTGSSATSASIKLLRALRGRPVEGWETAELLEPYGEWAGIASMYLLAGHSRGLLAA